MEDPRSASRNDPIQPPPPPPPPPPALAAEVKEPNESLSSTSSEGEVAGRERLKRRRAEVAGEVKIPDKWGQEQMMKDWIEFSTFDALLGSHRMIMAARDALVADARKAKSPRLRIQRSY